MEEWKDIPDFEGFYQASSFGNIRKICGKPIKQSNSKGYRVVRFTKNLKRTVESVHRIIAKTFLIRENGKDEVNHINANKSDNNVKNLEWCNRLHNVRHANKMNLINYSKKLNRDDVKKLRLMISSGVTVTETAKFFKIAIGTCSAINSFKHWKNIDQL